MKTDIGYVVGCWIAGIVLGVCLLVAVGGLIGWLSERKKPYPNHYATDALWAVFWAFVVAGFVAGAFVLVAWPPFNMEYHQYRPVAGTVAEVESRLIDQTTVYALHLTDGHIYRCDDTRCSLAHTGSRVSLWCIRVWQQASTPAWECNVDRIDQQEVER